MNWFYADNGEKRGPISEAEFENLIQFGTIRPETFVWCEGMKDWKPLKEVRPGADSNQPPPIAGASADAGEPSDQPSEADIRARDYALDASECFSRGWELVRNNPGSVIGASVLVYLCLMGIGSVPYIGPIAGLVLNGPLLGGLWFYFIAESRKRGPKPGDAFSGFGPQFLDLFLGNAVPSVFAMLAMLPVAIPAVAVALLAASADSRGRGAAEEMQVLLIVAIGVLVVVGLICLCVAIYLQICWAFTLPLVVDRKMGFWPAMSLSRAVVRKHFWILLLLGLLAWLLSLAGFLMCCVGIFLTGPIAFGAYTAAYEKMFGGMRTRQEG